MAESNFGVCELVAVILLAVILYSLACSCMQCSGPISGFTNMFGSSFMHPYNVMSRRETVKGKLQKLKGKPALFAVLSERCIHCKNLKKSGVLDKVAKKHKVYVMYDNHPEARDLMQMVQSRGFPTLAVYKMGSISLYVGKRTEKALLNALE